MLAVTLLDQPPLRLITKQTVGPMESRLVEWLWTSISNIVMIDVAIPNNITIGKNKNIFEKKVTSVSIDCTEPLSLQASDREPG